jgi:choice-of-anchor A domain-containing protein
MMNKNFTHLFLAALVSLSFTACGKEVGRLDKTRLAITEPSQEPTDPGEPTDPTEPTDPGACGNDPLASYAGISLYSHHGIQGRRIRASGQVMTSGDAFLKSIKVGTGLKLSEQRFDLAVPGVFVLKSAHLTRGGLKYVPVRAQISRTRVAGQVEKAEMFQFIDEYNDLQKISSNYAAYAFSGQTEIICDKDPVGDNNIPFCHLNLIGKKEGLNVFDVHAKDLQEIDFLSVKVPPSSRVLVNVHGTNVKWHKMRTMIPKGMSSKKVTWNHSETETLLINQSLIHGTVLAPNASVKSYRSHLTAGLVSHDADLEQVRLGFARLSACSSR